MTSALRDTTANADRSHSIPVSDRSGGGFGVHDSFDRCYRVLDFSGRREDFRSATLNIIGRSAACIEHVHIQSPGVPVLQQMVEEPAIHCRIIWGRAFGVRRLDQPEFDGLRAGQLPGQVHGGGRSIPGLIRVPWVREGLSPKGFQLSPHLPGRHRINKNRLLRCQGGLNLIGKHFHQLGKPVSDDGDSAPTFCVSAV